MCKTEAEDVRQVWSSLGIEQEIEALRDSRSHQNGRESYALEQYWSSGHYLDRVLVYMVATETECSWRGNSVTTTIGVVHRSNHNKL